MPDFIVRFSTTKQVKISADDSQAAIIAALQGGGEVVSTQTSGVQATHVQPVRSANVRTVKVEPEQAPSPS